MRPISDVDCRRGHGHLESREGENVHILQEARERVQLAGDWGSPSWQVAFEMVLGVTGSTAEGTLVLLLVHPGQMNPLIWFQTHGPSEAGSCSEEVGCLQTLPGVQAAPRKGMSMGRKGRGGV